MNEELENNTEEVETNSVKQQFTTVTTFSKYLALALFVALPFIGGWIGYHYAPEKVVEVEKIVFQEVENNDLGDELDSETLEKIDRLPSERTSTDEVILPNEKSLEEYSEAKVIMSDSYLNSFDCSSETSVLTTEGVTVDVLGFAGEFCNIEITIDREGQSCFLGTDNKGITSSYNTKKDLLSHCKNKIYE